MSSKNSLNHPDKDALILMPEEIAQNIPAINEIPENPLERIIYAHIYGITGDWFISGISETREIAYGFQLTNPESVWEMSEWITERKDWGEIPLKMLQDLVNEKFIKEKDIRFLIMRNLNWKKIAFSNINISSKTLTYPGVSDRISKSDL